MSIAIIIPARYGSTRFPGKPLALLGGRSILAHVVENARAAAANASDITVAVATDDARIADHCAGLNVRCVLTPADCKTGSDRVHAALQALGGTYTFALNVQGDSPFTQADFIRAVIDAHRAHKQADIITPVVQLRWDALDALRDAKRATPFSGTTAVIAPDGRALWFSKNILPAIRGEEKLRAASALSPVYRHIGLYGFRADALAKFIALPLSTYEKLEGLEQLRALEHGLSIQTVTVDDAGRPSMSGIDSPEDLARAEALLAAQTGKL